eukprot:c9533_g1_i1.p1 GENE.c9533_g1_i1~~c9533_g1_i1.p1  ORF type:complete len:440 (+),score=81.89 c9533_g1_i1:181-1320(+)
MSQANTASDALFTSLMTSVLDMWQAYKFHDASAFLKKHANPDIASKSIFGYVWTDIRNLMTLLMSNEERYHRLKHSDSYLTSKKTLWTVYAGLSTEFARVIRLFDSLTIDPNLVSGHGVQSSASKWMGALEEIVQIIHARRDMVQIFRGVQSLSSLQYELHDDSLNRLLSSLHSLPSLLRTFSTFTQIAEIKKDTLMEAKALQCCLEAYACLGSLEFLRTMALLHQAKHSLKLLSRDGDGDKGMTAHETYRWLKLLHTHLVSKATILFFRILQKQEKIVGVDILTQRPSIDPDFFAWVFELCSKHECSYVGIVFECGGRNIGDLGWTCPIPVGECSPQTVAGLQAWPVLFEFPQAITFHFNKQQIYINIHTHTHVQATQ